MCDVLVRVLESMGGPVVCSAANPAGHLVTEYNLEVLVPPSLTPAPPMLRATVMEGDTLRLFCRAAGNPLPQVRCCSMVMLLSIVLMLNLYLKYCSTNI